MQGPARIGKGYTMHSIWKYQLKIDDRQTIRMPAGADLLCVQVQRDIPVLYALVDPGARLVERDIIVFGTGHPIDDHTAFEGEYLGTVQQAGGSLVWHVFAVAEDIEEE